MVFAKKVMAIYNGISVEPILVLCFFCTSLSNSAADNLYLQKNCFPEAPLNTNEICPNPEKIALTAEISSARNILRTCVPGLVVTLAGTWRDRTGQSNPLIMFSLAGEILAAVIVMFGFYFWTSSSWLIAVLEGTVVGVTGGTQLLAMAANCHIIENSSLETRTRRIAYMVTSIFFALMLSAATTGFILSALNYSYLFLLAIALHIVNLFLAKMLIHDTVKENNEGSKLLDLKMLKTVFRRRENNIGIWSMILSSGFTFATIYGESPLSFLFLQKKFGYNVTQAGLYSAFRLAIITFGSFVIPPIMNKLFKIKDSTLIIVGALMSVTAAILLAFTETEVELFIFTTFLIFKSTQISAIKSSISKFLTPEEIGLYSSFDTISNALLPLAFIPLYTTIFNRTLKTWPGAYYLVSVGLDVAVFLLAILTRLMYGNVASMAKQNDANKMDTDPEKIEESHSSD